MKIPRRAFLISAVTLLSACAYSRAPAPNEAATTVRVDNQALLDMTIYAIRGSQRVRLGIANGLSVTTLRIPSSLIFGATSLSFLADPIGSNRTPISQEITVTAGDVITLTIPAQ